MCGGLFELSLAQRAYKTTDYMVFSHLSSFLVVTRLSLLLAVIVLSAGSLAAQQLEVVAYGDKPLGSYSPALESSLALKGSRREVLNFSIRAKGEGCGRIVLSPFTRSDKRVIRPEARFFLMERIRTSKPSFPGAFVGEHFDPLVPVPDKRVCLKNGQLNWLWGEIIVPADAEAGEYHSTLTIAGLPAILVKLQVWPMTIPDQPALPAYSEFTAWYNLLGHFGRWTDQEALLAQRYFSAMLDHRLVPIKLHIRRPPVVTKGGQLYLNIDSYPDRSQSFRTVSLTARPNWAFYDFPTVEPDQIGSAESERYFKAIENTVGQIGNSEKAFVYLWDEPGQENIPRLVEMAKKVRQWASSLKIMVTIPFYPELQDHVDIFAPVMDQFAAPGFAAAGKYRELQRAGKQVWWYVSCMSHGCDALLDSGRPDFVIDRPASYIRSIAWLSGRYEIDAFLYYSVNDGYQYYPKRDPWDDLFDFSGNGDGTLFYPGRPGERGLREHQPVPSIRLKLWREASYDAEYIRWMKQLPEPPDWWGRELNSIAASPQRWSRDYQAYTRLRERIGDYLANRLKSLD